MILLSSLIEQYVSDCLIQYKHRLLPSHRKALAAMKNCRTKHSPVMQTHCSDCGHDEYVPHSCGHRNCPHCQHHESQQWLERQSQKQVPANYFMITFTLPKELRPLTWQHQRTMYRLFFQCVWDTLQTFSQNDKQLKGTPGVLAVLHTHSRKLDYHPHIHTVIPAGAIEKDKQLWRVKTGKYLFCYKALAKVFRAKFLTALKKEGLSIPASPGKWVVNCKSVGKGNKAIVYLGRYLYRGVIQEKNILSNKNGNVTFRYINSKTKCTETRTVTGAAFLWLIVKHVLPKGFQRARNYGFLHPNSKTLIQLLQYLLKVDPRKWRAKIKERPQLTCPCCGAIMEIVGTQIHVISRYSQPVPT